MELVRKFYFVGPHKNRRYSVTQGFDEQCRGDREGELERTREMADNTLQKLAELVELLNEKGLLTNEDVLKLLPDFKMAPD